MAALIGSWIYGANALGDGYEELAFFRGDRPDIHAFTDPIPSADARDVAFAAGERWIAAKEGAKTREMPFGAASLLLGAAMVLFAARSMAGREGSRSALVQVVVVHAGALVAAYLLTRDVALAKGAFAARLNEGLSAEMLRGLNDPGTAERVAALRPLVERSLGPLALFLNVVFSALIITALTRPRARAFFHQPAAGPLGEG
jgi:hypothetical protein